PETGALLAAIRACVKLDETKIDVVGKPSPHLFQMGCQALDLSPDQVVMLGDNPATDLAGANALGIKAVLTSAKSPDVFEILLEAL
ncbi:HAD hydrolase-like protein, partial [Hyphomonas sp. UBA2515]